MSFYTTLLTDQQTNSHTDKFQVKRNFFGQGKKDEGLIQNGDTYKKVLHGVRILLLFNIFTTTTHLMLCTNFLSTVCDLKFGFIDKH